MHSYTINVYDDYDGGSRRAWFNKKWNLVGYDTAYEELNISGVNSLIITSDDPGSNSATFVLIPKGNKMYIIYFPGGSYSLTLFKEFLATFKFE